MQIKKNISPRVSIIMPVYNGEKYLRDAIDSILTQSFDDFEFIILADDSKDNSVELIKSYSDKRIQLIEHEEKKGIVGSLNEGLVIARGEYIARMDCDDICLPERIEKQVSFLDGHPNIGICGTWAKTIGGFKNELIMPPSGHNDIVVQMFFANSIIHPSVVFRKSIFTDGNYYNEKINVCEDYDLWVRLHKHTNFYNIPQFLIKYRLSLKSKDCNDRNKAASSVIQQKLIKELADDLSEKDWQTHKTTIDFDFKRSNQYLSELSIWFNKLLSSNKKNNKYGDKELANALAFRWFLICSKYSLVELLKSKTFRKNILKYLFLLRFQGLQSIVFRFSNKIMAIVGRRANDYN